MSPSAFTVEASIDGRARLFVPGRPHLINAERSSHRRRRIDATALYRNIGRLAGHQLITIRRYQFPTKAIVSSWPVYQTRRSWPDVGNWLPSTKALIDGLVDAGAWPDDNPDHIVGLLFEAPQQAAGDGLWVEVTPYED